MPESYFEKAKFLNVLQLNMLNNLVFMHKMKPKQHQKYFKTSFLNHLISILQIFPHPTTVYHHLNQASLNTEFQSEAPHYGRKFLQTLRKCKKM